MKTEFEVAFREVDKEDLRNKIESLWWVCVKENTLMKRVIFKSPMNEKTSYVRIRDEWGKITCTYKEIWIWKLDINSVKELETWVGDFESMVWIFKKIWLKQKAYQETYREIWTINNEIHFMIDEWPWLKPFIEIEWDSEDIVKLYSKKLWLWKMNFLIRWSNILRWIMNSLWFY
jgi:predicted adenylyl cyclase CyaB